MVTCQVVSVAYKRIPEEESSNEHARNGPGGTWKCAVCHLGGFNSIHEVKFLMHSLIYLSCSKYFVILTIFLDEKTSF